MRWSNLLASVVLLFASACVATPQPDPPSLDTDRVFASRGNDRESEQELAGLEGAIRPAGATLWVSPIDRADLPVRNLETMPDGSFTASLSIGRYRLQPRVDEARGNIVDVEVGDGSLRVETSASPCLRIPLEAEIEREAEIVIANDCAGEVTIAGASMRIVGDFDVLEVPTQIAAGASARLRVRLADAASGGREEILRIEIDRPIAERRAVTVFERSR